MSRTVAHLLPWPGVGGTETATLRVARAAAVAGYRSVAYVLEDAAPVRRFFEDHGIPTDTWQLRRPLARDAPAFALEAARLARSLKRRGAHVVHCADVRAASSVGALAGRMARAPVICHVRNRQDRIWAPYRRPLRLVDRFAFVSRDTWRRFGHDVPEQRGTVLYDGIGVPPVATQEARARTRTELGVPAQARIVGTVARVEPQKDFTTLARAAARLLARDEQLRFLVVGGFDGTPEQRDHFGHVRAELRAGGVEHAFVFTGFRTDVPRLIDAMDVFVLSTHWEGLPLVILEAMAHGRPVVATAVDGVPEVVEHGRTGLLVPHADDAALAAAIGQLLEDDGQARAVGEAGRAFVARERSERGFAEDVERLYGSVLDAERRGAA